MRILHVRPSGRGRLSNIVTIKMISKATINNLLEKIKSFEWCWHINHSIGGHDCWDEKLQAIGQVINAEKIIRLVTHTLFIGDTVELLRIPALFEFDNEGTGFKMFYKDPHTDAKWYIKKK